MDDSPLKHHGTTDELLKQRDIEVAERDGTLQYVGSTYSLENDALYDGLSRPGVRIVTFAPILRHKMFPLPEIVELLLRLGSWGMGTPVEIEFAVSLQANQPAEFGLLQMRPLVLSRETERLNIESMETKEAICVSTHVLGNGIIRDLYDIVVVDSERFDRSKSKEVAREITRMNETLIAEDRPYLLIGVGRWGTLDPWLGIPVKWDQISGARAIVEASFKDMEVAPSQGSHFFQNITSFMVGYFSINSRNETDFLDWGWLSSQPAAESGIFVRHLRFNRPIVVKMNGQENKGIILKPM
jgi:hypothetical protein